MHALFLSSGIINCTYKKCIFKRHESCYLSINASDLMMKVLLPIFEQLCVVDSRVLQSVNRLERIYWYYICTKGRAYEKKSECYWKEALKSLLRFWKRDLNILLYGHKIRSLYNVKDERTDVVLGRWMRPAGPVIGCVWVFQMRFSRPWRNNF